MKTNEKYIDMRATMYPSFGKLTTKLKIDPYSTVYGYVFGTDDVTFPNGQKATADQYFCYPNFSQDHKWIISNTEFVSFVRLGYLGHFTIGGPVEDSGRLCYIDGCSDSLLIYPPRLGDPSLNALFFPEGIEQSYHIHPSIRLGFIAKGSGYCDLNNKRISLQAGNLFCIEEREYHRFVTEIDQMVVMAYHPDGDWGPTDENHTMLNRTYLTK